MALTRRFFKDLATKFREARPNVGGDFPEMDQAFAVWMHMVTLTANAFAVQNAMFNHEKFYEASGMPQPVIDRMVARN